ncbi:MAG: hypothetical protein DRJ62_07065 [Thermoprotei archaeon]|nr:MAG: hypothetical protein DRJ62_07065 [Thermoprotei archaeon]
MLLVEALTLRLRCWRAYCHATEASSGVGVIIIIFFTLALIIPLISSLASPLLAAFLACSRACVR